jgi:hypothetical protein
MSRRVLMVFFVFLAARLLHADCIANGHYTIVGNAVPLIGTRYPYTEDLASRRDALPVPALLTVGYHRDGRWTKIQTGCASSRERNVSASTAVNLLLRASLRVDAHTAPHEARYQVQIRFGYEVVMTETRRLGEVPRSDRFATVVRQVPAGNYVYSLWLRLLDGPESNQATADLQWITAQGVPVTFGAARAESGGEERVGGDWTMVGPALFMSNTEPIDLALQSSFTVEEAGDGAALDIAYTVDRDPLVALGRVAVPGIRPDSLVTFDARPSIGPGIHSVRMWMRSTQGRVRVSSLRFEMVSFPSEDRDLNIIPMVRVEANDELLATTAGDDEQTPSLSPICGRWTKLLQFQLPPSDGDPSWNLEGYIEVLDTDVSGYGQLAMVAIHRNEIRNGVLNGDPTTDMGIFELQARPGGDGFFFYGDASKWGNDLSGDEMSLWIRRIEGCRDAPFGGGFRIGRRWLAVKLLPSEGPHLQ